MGFLDWVGNAWDGVKSTASKAWSSVKNGATQVWDGIKNGASTVAKTVIAGGKAIAKGIPKVINKGEDIAKTIYNDAKDFANKPFQLLSNPITMITLGIGGIAAIMLLSKAP